MSISLLAPHQTRQVDKLAFIQLFSVIESYNEIKNGKEWYLKLK
jgi:hypothetical protein